MIPTVPELKLEPPGHSGSESTPLLAMEENREAVSAGVAARLLGKSPDTIYRWLDAGRLAGRKVGGRWLVYRDSIEAQWQRTVVEPPAE